MASLDAAATKRQAIAWQLWVNSRGRRTYRAWLRCLESWPVARRQRFADVIVSRHMGGGPATLGALLFFWFWFIVISLWPRGYANKYLRHATKPRR